MAPRKRGKKAASGGAQKRARTSKKQEPADDATEDTDKAVDSEETKEQQPTESSASEQKTSTADDSKQGAPSREGGGPELRVVEKGHLFAFFRPKVDAKEVKGPDDVSKFYILLSPDGAEGRPAREEDVDGKRGEERAPLQHEGKPMHRLLAISAKTFPDPGKTRPRVWAFVDAVSSDLHEVEHKLERYSYDTKTRGHRDIQPARLAAEARYEIVHHVGKDSHMVYELEYPAEPGEVQKAFHIHKEGQLLVTVKNPVFNSPAYSDRWAGFKGEDKAQFPAHLVERFKGKVKDVVRYTPLDTADFLNHQHCELVLIGTSRGDDLTQVMEELERDVDEEGPKDEREAYQELQADPKEFPDSAESFKAGEAAVEKAA